MKLKRTICVIFVLFVSTSMACSLTGNLRSSMSVPTATPAPTITAIPAPTPTVASEATCVVSVEHLNLREGPGMNAAVIAVLNSGDYVTILPEEEKQGSWAFVTVNGRKGWINQIFCKKIGDNNE